MEKENIYQNLPVNLADESFETIIKTKNVVVERIVSLRHASPPKFWYDQDKNEWLLLIKGQACLRFEKGNKKIVLNPGDYITIPAHARHRVEWTDTKVKNYLVGDPLSRLVFGVCVQHSVISRPFTYLVSGRKPRLAKSGNRRRFPSSLIIEDGTDQLEAIFHGCRRLRPSTI